MIQRRRSDGRPRFRRRLAVAAAGLLLAGCGQSDDPDRHSSRDADSDSGSSEAVPSDATLTDFCFAVSGIESDGFDHARGDLIQERIALLKATGAPEGAPDDLHRAIERLVERIERLGIQARPVDLDDVEDRSAREPYDYPNSGIREYWEENCDGVYTEEFSSPGQGDIEEVINDQFTKHNQLVEGGPCERLSEVYAAAEDLLTDLVARCSIGALDTYTLVGGGVTGPDTADVVVQVSDGTTFEDTMVKEDDAWKLFYA